MKSRQINRAAQWWMRGIGTLMLAVATLAASVEQSSAQPPPGRPDLVVRYFGLKEWGACVHGQALFTFQVTVANIGTAPSPGFADKALLLVRDQHTTIWGSSTKLDAIAPGASQTVLLPVYYLQGNHGHVTGEASHPFQATVDPLRLVTEVNEANNQSPVINVDAASACPATPPQR